MHDRGAADPGRPARHITQLITQKQRKGLNPLRHKHFIVSLAGSSPALKELLDLSGKRLVPGQLHKHLTFTSAEPSLGDIKLSANQGDNRIDRSVPPTFILRNGIPFYTQFICKFLLRQT